jgi:hypothetical protein
LDEDELEAELACLGEEFDEGIGDEIGLEQPSYLTPSGMPHVPASNVPVSQPVEQTVSNNTKVDEFGLPVQNLV